MEFEKIPIIEKNGKNREKLLELEKTGKYIFHGSPYVLTSIDFMQAEGENLQTGEMEKDGNPAVCASDLADQAIFRSLVHEKRGQGNSTAQFGTNEKDQLFFLASQDLIDIAKNGKSTVYVFEKSQMKHHEGHEWRAEQVIAPIYKIEVTFDDLPKNIKIIE